MCSCFMRIYAGGPPPVIRVKLREMIQFALKEATISLEETQHPPKLSKTRKNCSLLFV